MILVGSGIGWTDYADLRSELCDAFDKIVQFANSFFRGESQVFECESEINSELSRACGRRTGRWIEEIVFSFDSHLAVSITLTNARKIDIFTLL